MPMSWVLVIGSPISQPSFNETGWASGKLFQSVSVIIVCYVTGNNRKERL